MMLFGRFFWGTISVWVWRKHMTTEAIPYAKMRGYNREQMRRTVLKRGMDAFDEIWPEDAATDRGAKG
jgi:hypothetical protein